MQPSPEGGESNSGAHLGLATTEEGLALLLLVAVFLPVFVRITRPLLAEALDALAQIGNARAHRADAGRNGSGPQLCKGDQHLLVHQGRGEGPLYLDGRARVVKELGSLHRNVELPEALQ